MRGVLTCYVFTKRIERSISVGELRIGRSVGCTLIEKVNRGVFYAPSSKSKERRASKDL